MWVAFALQKLLTFFQQKISAYLCINVNFNESLTNDVISFEQLGPGLLDTTKFKGIIDSMNQVIRKLKFEVLWL